MSNRNRFGGFIMQGLWLVEDPTSFALNPGGSSPKDRCLPLSLSYEEWFQLFFDVLGADKKGFDERMKANGSTPTGFIGSFTGEIEGFPLLSRINGHLVDVVFELPEIEQLRGECLRVKQQTKNNLALCGVEKLLRACKEALTQRLNIYFLAD